MIFSKDGYDSFIPRVFYNCDFYTSPMFHEKWNLWFLLLNLGKLVIAPEVTVLLFQLLFFLNRGYQWNVCCFPLPLCLIFLSLIIFFVNFLIPFFSLFSIVFFLLGHIYFFGQGADGGQFGKYFSIMLAISNWDPVAHIPSPLLLENEIK